MARVAVRHPTIVAFLPGVAGWYLWRNLGALRTRWPYLGALAFLVAFSPMIWFNVQTGGESIRYAIYTATERAKGLNDRFLSARHLPQPETSFFEHRCLSDQSLK